MVALSSASHFDFRDFRSLSSRQTFSVGPVLRLHTVYLSERCRRRRRQSMHRRFCQSRSCFPVSRQVKLNASPSDALSLTRAAQSPCPISRRNLCTRIMLIKNIFQQQYSVNCIAGRIKAQIRFAPISLFYGGDFPRDSDTAHRRLHH